MEETEQTLYDHLLAWAVANHTYPMQDPEAAGVVDFHRLQVEYWLAVQATFIDPALPAIDIGAEWSRGPGILQLNTHSYSTAYGEVRPDVHGTIVSLPFRTACIGTVICTEVLEHVANIFRAIAEITRVLAPGGRLLATTPFLWPEHPSEHYGDFWRLTRQGWEFLLSANGFRDIVITPTVPRDDSINHLAMVRANEIMSMNIAEDSIWATGYLVSAVHP